MNPYHHAVSSVKKHGGRYEDYLPLHQWFDESKMMMADFRHRALRHHAEGIFMCERIFGAVIKNSDGKMIPVRFIGEQHVREDCGWIPSVEDWLKHINAQPWMKKVGMKEVSDDTVHEGRIEEAGRTQEGTQEVVLVH